MVLDNGLVIGCATNGYGDRLLCCKIVVALRETEGYNVFACIDDLINNFTVLCNNNGKLCTIGCGCLGNVIFLGIVDLGIVVCVINGNACLCNGKFNGVTCNTDEVFIALEDCLDVVSACIRGNGCGVLTVDCGCIYVGYRRREVYCVCGYVCGLTERPTLNTKLQDNGLCLCDLVTELDIIGCTRAIPLVVVLITEDKSCDIIACVNAALVGNGVFIGSFKTGGQSGAVVYLFLLIVCNRRNLDGCLFDYKLTGCNEILVVRIGCCESCNVCACVGGKLGAVCIVAGTCGLILDLQLTDVCNCRTDVSCLTVYPRSDHRSFCPCVFCLGNGVGQCQFILLAVGPDIVVADKSNGYGIGANVNAAFIGHDVTLSTHQTGCEKLAIIYLLEKLIGDGRCIDLLLGNLDCNGYLAVLVVACGAGEDCCDGIDACVANGGYIFLDAPNTLDTLGKLDLVGDEITVGCVDIGEEVISVGCLADNNGGGNLYAVVVFAFGKRQCNGVCACVLNNVNDLTVFLEYELESTFFVRRCNCAEVDELLTVVDSFVNILYVVDRSICLCELNLE